MAEQTEKEKMLAGELYRSADEGLAQERRRAQTMLAPYNATPADEMLGSVGDQTIVQPIVSFDYGYNISLGRNVFINYQCVLLDCAPIEIGDDVQIGPAVQLYTADHPLDPGIRKSGFESARPIRIGRNVWIEGSAIVLPGVTIGDNSVVGAGSVVVRDVPPATVVVGNPARAIRSLA